MLKNVAWVSYGVLVCPVVSCGFRDSSAQNHACVQGSTNGTNGIPISLNVLPMVPLVIPVRPVGQLKTYVTGTFFKALVAMDVTPYVPLQPSFRTEF